MSEYQEWPGGTRKEVGGFITWRDGTATSLIYTWPKAIVAEIQYPQSLGELCIELAQERIARYGKRFPQSAARYSHESIQALRTAMYHRANRAEFHAQPHGEWR